MNECTDLVIQSGEREWGKEKVGTAEWGLGMGLGTELVLPSGVLERAGLGSLRVLSFRTGTGSGAIGSVGTAE